MFPPGGYFGGNEFIQHLNEGVAVRGKRDVKISFTNVGGKD